jgi:hypothetical protein
VVGGAILVGDLERPHAERLGQRAGSFECAVCGAGDGGAGACERGGDGHQGVQGEGLVRRQRNQRRGPGDMSDERAKRDCLRRLPNLRVGYTQQDAVGSLRTSLAAAQRPGDLEAGGAQGGGERRAHSARAHDHAVAGKR